MPRRILIFAAASVLVATTVGCSTQDDGPDVIGADDSSVSADPKSSEPDTSASDFVVASGFTSGTDSIGTRYTSAGARLTNPNSDLAAYEVQVLFNLISENGDVLDSSSETVYYIGPGETVPVAPLQIGFEVDEEPTQLQVQVVGEFTEDEGPRGTFGGDAAILEFVGGKFIKGDYDQQLTAQVSNPTDVVIEYPEWDCIYLRGENIVGGSSSTIIDPIPPGTTVQFSESLSPDNLKPTSVECRVVADL